MSRFKQYLEAINTKTKGRLKKLKILDLKVGEVANQLEKEIKNWKGTGHEFMEIIKEKWIEGWDIKDRPDTEAIEREFEREKNIYYITLRTPASSSSKFGKYGHTTVDKNLIDPEKRNNKDDKIKKLLYNNIKDAQRRDILQMGLHTALNRISQSGSLPTWIKSFKKYNDTLEIKIQ